MGIVHSGEDHSHSHGHNHGASGGSATPRVLIKAMIITLLFMVVEAIGGYLANSLALLSDAAHMLMDVGAILLSLFAYWITRRPSTSRMSFGYHRAEILGALASGLAIWLLAGVLVYEAIERVQDPPEVKGPLVFGIALVGLGANLFSMKILHGATHGSMNVRAAYLHILADALGSVAAVIAGAAIWWGGWLWIDPVVTFLFALLMLGGSWKLVKEAVGVLMEGSPVGINPDEVRQELSRLSGVEGVHDLHIWTVSTRRYALSVHLVSRNSQNLLLTAQEMLREKYGIGHTTIQIESPENFQSDRCYDCGTP